MRKKIKWTYRWRLFSRIIWKLGGKYTKQWKTKLKKKIKINSCNICEWGQTDQIVTSFSFGNIKKFVKISHEANVKMIKAPKKFSPKNHKQKFLCKNTQWLIWTPIYLLVDVYGITIFDCVNIHTFQLIRHFYFNCWILKEKTKRTVR